MPMYANKKTILSHIQRINFSIWFLALRANNRFSVPLYMVLDIRELDYFSTVHEFRREKFSDGHGSGELY